MGQATTTITLDIYGKLTTVRQAGAHNGYAIDEIQRYYYDARERQCRHTVRETGDTLFQFDGAGHLLPHSPEVAPFCVMLAPR